RHTGVPVLRAAGRGPRTADARKRRQPPRCRQLRDPRLHRDQLRLEPRSAAVHADPGRGDQEPASGKRGVWMMRRLTRPRDERGNMIVVMAVIMVLLFLSIAVVARTTSGLKSTRQGQDFSAALAQADAGLSDALFRIDQLGLDPATTFCVCNNVACSVSSIPGAPDVQYTARRVDDNTYTVYSKGLVNGQYHAI